MRDARAEAAERVGGRYDVRVLEPSPPAIVEGPFFADDPVAGGQVVPVHREGAQSWAALCEREEDESLRAWCEARWLLRPPLSPLPAGFERTRASLHALAEHVIAPCRHDATAKIGLRFTHRGFGTPFLPGDRQVRVDAGILVDSRTEGDREHELTTLGEAARFLGTTLGAPIEVYRPTTPGAAGTPLLVDTPAALALGDWFGFCASLLEQLRADAGAAAGAADGADAAAAAGAAAAMSADAPSRVQLWPEHFDLAVDLGPEGRRANFGGSPGDDAHPEPYLYVGPWEPRRGEFWNEPFGASLSYRELLGGADGLAFLRQGRALL